MIGPAFPASASEISAPAPSVTRIIPVPVSRKPALL